MSGTAFVAKRVTRSYQQKIEAAPDTVFPLLCPVREAEWLDGWAYTMLRSASGLVEEGAVFTTPMAGEPDTVWIVSRHDPEERRVEFCRFTPGSRVCVLSVHVSPDQREGRSLVDITYTYTAIAEAGNAFIDSFTEEAFRHGVRFWEDSMNHWLATGERLTESGR